MLDRWLLPCAIAHVFPTLTVDPPTEGECDMRELTLYGKPDCSLCDKMKETVERVRRGIDLNLKIVSIESDPKLWERFWKDIPVLAEGTEVLFRHRVTEEALTAALRGKTAGPD